jgi:phytoene dehydrogenase-like protein
MKVLIAEQHFKPGGYCTSFRRKGFIFDAAAHSFGGYRYGPLGNIFRELEIEKRINIKKFDPSDIIITPDYKVSFWTDLNKTIHSFQSVFPVESSNIEKFFHFLLTPDPNSFSRMKSWTFNNLLDQYFTDDKLKASLSFPLFGNGALPPSLMSAFIGAKIFKEYLLDGGYYPEDSMQALPDALTEIFADAGGELRLSCPVMKIRVKDRQVEGVVTDKSDFIPARYVISNCDARQTFFKLLGQDEISNDFSTEINKMVTSLSIFILYLGVNEHFIGLPDPGANLWFMRHYNLDKAYLSAKHGDFNDIGGYLIHVSPDQKSVLAFMNAPFKNKTYWMSHKEKMSDFFLKMVETEAIPHLSENIKYKEAATPYTLYRYTLNTDGAAYGWACMPSQFAIPDVRKPSFIRGLYLTGHWTTQGLGIPGVVYVGYDTAMTLLRKNKIRQKKIW